MTFIALIRCNDMLPQKFKIWILIRICSVTPSRHRYRSRYRYRTERHHGDQKQHHIDGPADRMEWGRRERWEIQIVDELSIAETPKHALLSRTVHVIMKQTLNLLAIGNDNKCAFVAAISMIAINLMLLCWFKDLMRWWWIKRKSGVRSWPLFDCYKNLTSL